MSNSYRNQPTVRNIDLGKIPEPRLFILRNGVPVYLINAGTEDIVRMEFIFGAGNKLEDLPLVASAGYL